MCIILKHGGHSCKPHAAVGQDIIIVIFIGAFSCLRTDIKQESPGGSLQGKVPQLAETAWWWQLAVAVRNDEPTCCLSLSNNDSTKTKWPKWFVPTCISKLSLVYVRGTPATPAFSISMSMTGSDCSLLAKVLTLSRSARSSC